MDKIKRLEEFKQDLLNWSASYDDQALRQDLRSKINQNKVWIRQEVIEAKCLKRMTISPPVAVSGLIMRNINPFDMMFEAPYGMSFINVVADMIYQTIGEIKNSSLEENVNVTEEKPQIEMEIEENYEFVAMPINPDNPELEDRLYAIKEGSDRCGVLAERVDEVETNDKITDRILESIRKAQFVIVDLTDSKPNVFYEAGYAQGIGKTPVYIAKNGSKLEFDLKDYPVIFFKNMKQLKDRLEARLRALA